VYSAGIHAYFLMSMPGFSLEKKFFGLKRWQRLFISTVAVMCIATPIATSSFAVQNLPTLGDADREGLTPVVERRLGERIMRDIRRDMDYLDDVAVSEYLNNFGDKLIAVRPEVRGEAGYDYYFFAIRNPVLNAFALPGGFIGVHSGLILAAQSESELASVLAHEIGHVAQRHIARMLGQQKQNSMIQLASFVLGALTARASSDGAMAAMMGGTGYAIQRQLNFSRDAEREADRIGLQLLTEGGYETSGMVAFFGRLQNASRNYSSNMPSYLMTHPLTTERIADIESRIRGQRYRQYADNVDFQFVRARVRVLQYSSVQGLRDSKAYFENQLNNHQPVQKAAAQFGLAFVAYQQGEFGEADTHLQQAYRLLPESKKSLLMADMNIDIKLGLKQTTQALALADAARKQFPVSRLMAYQYATTLIEAKRYAPALEFLRDQVQLYRSDVYVQHLLAKVYEAQGKQALLHMTLAESYVLSGSLPSAIEQLGIARKAEDATFYEQSVIDARERELKERWLAEQQEMKDFS
jgi:predicted Zn-dependent protease